MDLARELPKNKNIKNERRKEQFSLVPKIVA